MVRTRPGATRARLFALAKIMRGTWTAGVRPRASAHIGAAKTLLFAVRARLSLFASRVGTWPSSVRVRVREQVPRKIGHSSNLSGQLVGEVVLGTLLLAMLAFSPRDAVPSDGYDPAIWSTTPHDARYVASTLLQSSFALTLPSMTNLSAWTSTTGALRAKALIPSAPPVELLIPALRVHRPVEGVGVDRRGVMDLPVNAWNAGWYKGGPVPGAPGDAVIEGHAGYPDQPMIFGKLASLRQGDKVIVVLADGSQHLFLIESMAVFPIGAAPPGMAEPYGPPRLTLITCTGSFDANLKFYSKRLVVEASYAGLA